MLIIEMQRRLRGTLRHSRHLSLGLLLKPAQPPCFDRDRCVGDIAEPSLCSIEFGLWSSSRSHRSRSIIVGFLSSSEYVKTRFMRVRPILRPLREAFGVNFSPIRPDMAEKRRRTVLRRGLMARFEPIAQGEPSRRAMKSSQRPVLRTDPGGGAQ